MIRNFLLALVCVSAGAAWAEDVTLSSLDGSVELSGQILGFDGEYYRLGTTYGELTVDASGVTCDGPGCPNLTDFVPEITIVGATPLAERLLPAVLEAYALRNRMTIGSEGTGNEVVLSLLRPASGDAALRIRLRPGTTDAGIAALLSGDADLALALRAIRPEERQAAQAAGLGDLDQTGRALVVALDALVPAVAPGNPVHSISPTDLARVFGGVITNWAELGGEDAPISLHLPPEGSGLAQSLDTDLLAPEGLSLGDGIRHDRTSDMAASAAQNPFGIALVARSELGSARALALASGCGYALRATSQTVKTEDYPLTTPLFMYQPMRRLPKAARDVLTYLTGPDAQMVIRAAGFTDQMPERIGLAGQGNRLANAILGAGAEVSLVDVQDMVALMRATGRLSLTIRFDAGAPRPDAQSRGNIAALGRMLETGSFDGRRLIFAGFSDGDGGAAANQRIAARRAEAVRDAVLEAASTFDPDRVAIEVKGFGEALPMACDDSARGRQINRRVEVWTR